MKKLIIPILIGLVFYVQPLFAKTVCLTGAGAFWVLSGGKENLKPFEGFLNIPGSCHAAAWASVVVSAPGVLQITIDSAQDALCSSVFVTAQTDLAFTGTFTFDNGEDGTNDGSGAITEVNCSTVPPPVPNGSLQKPESGPGAPPKR